MSSAQLLVNGFNGLEYVTNPYALFGFVFLVGMIVIGLLITQQKARAILLTLLAVFALGATYALLESAVTKIEEQLLVHLVRHTVPTQVAPGVEIRLVDIETLKGKKNWKFNVRLDDSEHVFEEVFVRAGVDLDGKKALAEMNADSWGDFLQGLEDSNECDDRLKAEKIKDIPFSKFRVFIDGVEDPTVSGKYYFKGDTLCLPTSSPACNRAQLKIVNIYNTKDKSSGEPEAVNVRVLPESAS